jgi:hypothetical protein
MMEMVSFKAVFVPRKKVVSRRDKAERCGAATRV